MNEPPEQAATLSKRTRAARGTKSATRKRAEQATPLPETSSPAEPSEPPIGEKWGEFPPPERQVALAQRLQEWNQESDHGDRPGPFAGFGRLTGADVFWLAVQALSKKHKATPGNTIASDLLKGLLPHPTYLNLQSADLSGAQLQKANLGSAQLQGANLKRAKLQNAHLSVAQLQGANLVEVEMQYAHLQKARLTGARLLMAELQHAEFWNASLEEAVLEDAHLESASLRDAYLDGANLHGAWLHGVKLQRARFDVKTRLINARIDAHIQVVDVIWNGAPLTRLNWEEVPRLGDEERVQQTAETLKVGRGQSMKQKKSRAMRMKDYQAAIRANRQLAVALRSQGMNEVADRFAYRAQVLQRELLWLEAGLPMPGFKRFLRHLPHRVRTLRRVVRRYLSSSAQRPLQWSGRGIWHRWQRQHALHRPLPVQEREPVRSWYKRFRPRKLIAWLISLLLAIISGYGYKVGQSLIIYLCVLIGFTGLYLLNSHFVAPHLTWDQALVLSVSCFHGRGFFEQDITLGSTYARLAAFEAVIGLLIEISFIATFTQRYFSR